MRRLVLLAALLLGCAPVLPVDVEVVTHACSDDAAEAPLAGASQLRSRYYGPGTDSTQAPTVVPLSQRDVTLAPVPVGHDRWLLVEALTASNDVVRSGLLGPLEFTAVDRVTGRVVLRTLGTFSPLGSADPQGCDAGGLEARAGHTASLLPDGRVFLAGGYVMENGHARYLATTELVDPRTGRTEQGPTLALRRAGHSATRVPNSPYVVIAGGTSIVDATEQGAPAVEIFDVEQRSFRVVAQQSPRLRHAAAVPPEGGPVLLVGGLTAPHGTPLLSTEVIDTSGRESRAGPNLPFPLVDASAIGLPGGRVLVVGGYDGTRVHGGTVLFRQQSGTYVLEDGWNGSIPTPVRAPALALAGRHVVVAGGFTGDDEPSTETATNRTSILDFETGDSAAGPDLGEPRAGPCIASLADGAVLVAGGAHASGTAELITRGAEILRPSPDDERVDALPTRGRLTVSRYQAACATLPDGTVFVSGGLKLGSGPGETLRSIEIFQPPYQASAAGPFR